MPAAELKVVTKTYDLTLWLLTQINKLPRSYRFVLGDRMETTTLDILELLLEATYLTDDQWDPILGRSPRLERASLGGARLKPPRERESRRWARSECG